MRISTSYAITTPESAKDGDHAETGWRDEEGREFDDVGEAIDWLRREGASEPSSSSFGPRVWYSSEPIPNYRTGADTTYSFHLHGFSEYEQRKVFNAITGRSNPMKKRARRSTGGWQITRISSHAARAVSGSKLAYAIRRQRGGAVAFDYPKLLPAWVKVKMRKLLRGKSVERKSFLRSNPQKGGWVVEYDRYGRPYYLTGTEGRGTYEAKQANRYASRTRALRVKRMVSPRAGKVVRLSRSNPAGAADPRGSVYGQRVKLRGYNGPVSVLTAHSLSGAKTILRRLFPTYTKQDHAAAATAHERAAKRFETLWGRTIEKAHRETFGKKWSGFDYRISGIGRDEYPERLKKILRMAAQRGSAHSAVATYHRALAGRGRS